MGRVNKTSNNESEFETILHDYEEVRTPQPKARAAAQTSAAWFEAQDYHSLPIDEKSTEALIKLKAFDGGLIH